jgi:hypothetical protein
MRKKLLALLMCATMVLGSSAVAFADYTNDDVENAQKIVDQYDYFKAEFNEKAFGKTSDAAQKFTTTYTDGTKEVSTTYTYAFTGAGAGAFVKVGPTTDEAKVAKINDKELVNVSSSNRVTAHVDEDGVMNNSVVLGDLLKLDDGATTNYYYVSDVQTTGPASLANGIVEFTNAAGSTLYATLTGYDTSLSTGYIIYGKTSDFQDEYGVDPDGYIPLAASTTRVQKYYTTLSDKYVARVYSADSAQTVLSIATALNSGALTKNAVAVAIDFYGITDLNGYAPVNYGDSSKSQTGYKQLYYVYADRNDVSLSLKTDWLSRTNLKKADAVSVYLLDYYTAAPSIYNHRVDELVSLGNVDGGKFTADYVMSGVYIFDEATAASNNDGVSDTDTTATTTASATAASSPKTGDVAPIAALAVVMMGACGAMVVASKKRA